MPNSLILIVAPIIFAIAACELNDNNFPGAPSNIVEVDALDATSTPFLPDPLLGKSCVSDTECEQWICWNNRCGYQCTKSDQCEAEERCEDLRCVERPPCPTLQACPVAPVCPVVCP